MTVTDLGTIAIAAFAFASLVSTTLFYTWTRKQNHPHPALISAFGMQQSAEPPEGRNNGVWLRILLTVSNPGAVPIHILSMTALPRNAPEVGCGWIIESEFEQGTTVNPYTAKTLEQRIFSETDEDVLFPIGVERLFEISITYLSAGRQARGTFGKVLGIERISLGGWSSTPHYRKRRLNRMPRTRRLC